MRLLDPVGFFIMLRELAKIPFMNNKRAISKDGLSKNGTKTKR